MCAREPASLWRETGYSVLLHMGFSENIAVGGNKFTSVIFLQLGDGLSSFDKNNRVNVSGEKKKIK